MANVFKSDRGSQQWGTAAIAGIAAALGSLAITIFADGTWSNITALLVGLIAIPLGLLGVLFSLSPRTRGGLVSIAAIVLGVVASAMALVSIFIPG